MTESTPVEHGTFRIRGYEAVRGAARDWETYSSDLQGESDIRDYRQLPLEADPPRHTLFRNALQPLFMSGAVEPKADRFEALATRLIRDVSRRGSGEIASELALPYVVGCLSIIYNRPQDYEEWLSWGIQVFDIDQHHSAATVDAYVHRVLDAAESRAGDELADEDLDMWDSICRLDVGGAPISRAEMHGIASVLLAGGRDTVIKLVSGVVWHLTNVPDDREFLREQPEAINRFLSEMVRYLSPLEAIERLVVKEPVGLEREVHPGERVLLDFRSGNMDRTIWPDAGEIDIHRERRPNLAFGFGRHSCLGMNVALIEANAFVKALLADWPGWTLGDEQEIQWRVDGEGPHAVKTVQEFRSVRVTTERH